MVLSCYLIKTPLCNREFEFSRAYTPKAGTKWCDEDNRDDSSLSVTDISADEYDKDLSVTPVNQSNSVGDMNGVYANIELVTGINPNQIKSTRYRPTMIMRELIKKCDRIGDKTYLKEHESLFKEFIQMKCIIIDDNMSILWKEIMESLSRQHIDEENNKKKRINKQPFLMLTNPTSQLLQT
ncbi:unnamed protein product, partial [Rotaria magnacalcarata]